MRRPLANRWVPWVLSSLGPAVLLLTSCQSMRVREIEEPTHNTVLMVARGTEEAVLSWHAEKGVRYMVLYADSRASGARWQTLPGADLIVGTGAPVTIRDPIPATRPRYYRLELIPSSDRRP